MDNILETHTRLTPTHCLCELSPLRKWRLILETPTSNHPPLYRNTDVNDHGIAKERVEGSSPGLNTWLVLYIICCFQNGSNFGKEHGKAHKQSLSCSAALVICLGLQVKNLSLPWEDKSTFQLCNLEESDSLTRRSLRKVHSSSKAQHSKEVGRKYAPIPYLHCCDVIERPSNTQGVVSVDLYSPTINSIINLWKCHWISL